MVGIYATVLKLISGKEAVSQSGIALNISFFLWFNGEQHLTSCPFCKVESKIVFEVSDVVQVFKSRGR